MSLSIAEVNLLDPDRFLSIFGNVIELCVDAAYQVLKKKPFGDVEDLCAAFNGYLDNLAPKEQLNVLKLHPDLAGRLAIRGELTKESTGEQNSAGLFNLTQEQKDAITSFNERYTIKFGFPFVICARENKVQAILEGLQTRYNNRISQELTIGIAEVKKICKYRILDIVK